MNRFSLTDIDGDLVDPQPDRYIFAEGCRHVIGYAWSLGDGLPAAPGSSAPEVQVVGMSVQLVGAVSPAAAAALDAALAAANAYVEALKASRTAATLQEIEIEILGGAPMASGSLGMFQAIPSTWATRTRNTEPTPPPSTTSS